MTVAASVVMSPAIDEAIAPVTERELSVCIFRSETDKPPQGKQIPWREVCQLHQHRYIRPSKSGPMIGGYSCDGPRNNQNVAYRSLIQLDIDTEGEKDPETNRITKVTKAAPPVETIRSGIDEYEWIAASSHNHAPTEGVIKYRIVMLPDRDVMPDEYPALLEAIDELLGGVLDRGAWQWSQAFYLPSCPQAFEAEAFYIHNEGVPLPVAEFVARGREIMAARQTKRGPTNIGGTNGSGAGPETPEGTARMKSALQALDPNMGRFTGWLDAIWAVAAHDWPSGYGIAREW